MEYEQGSKQTFYTTFVELNTGREAIVSGTPTIMVSHRWGNSKTTDVDNQDMSLLSGSTYFYRWSIPVNSDKTTYNIRYHAVYSGIDLTATPVVGAEEFQVIPKRFYDKKGGGFVQKVSLKGAWTEKEKDAVVLKIDKIASGLEPVLGRILDFNPKDYSEELGRIVDSLVIVGRDVNRLSELNARLSEDGRKLDELSKKITSIPAPEKIDLNGIRKSIEGIKEECNVLGDIEKGFSRVGATMLAVEGVSTQLGKLSKSFEEAKELYLQRIPAKELVGLLSTEKLRGLKHGD